MKLLVGLVVGLGVIGIGCVAWSIVAFGKPDQTTLDRLRGLIHEDVGA